MSYVYYISGPDGSGKTTHVMALLDELRAKGVVAKYVWLRSPKLISKPLLAYCRLRGLTKYWEVDGIRVGNHHFYKSKLISRIYPWLQLIDMMIFKFIKITIPFHFKKKTIIMDRFIYDTLVDLMIDTNRYNMHTENVGKWFLKMIPVDAKVVFLDADENILRERKKDVSADSNVGVKRRLFLHLAKDLKIPVVDAGQQYEIVEKKIQKELGCNNINNKKNLNKQVIGQKSYSPLPVLRNWLFQRFFSIDRGMRLFKLFSETIFFITFFSVFYFMTILPVYYSIITSMIIAHTVFWLLFCPVWYPIICSLNIVCISPDKLIKYVESLNSRLQKENFILYAIITGSMSRGELHNNSDLDIKIIRKKGFKNLLSATLFIIKETFRAQMSKIPLELLMGNSVEYLNKTNTDESPIVLFDPHGITKKKFKKYYWLNDVYKINKTPENQNLKTKIRYRSNSSYRIVVYSEVLQPPFDEGIKKTAYEITRALSKKAEVLAVCKLGTPSENPKIKVIPSNRLLLSQKLKKEINDFSPEVIMYIPPACGTLWSFVRGKILSYYIKNRKVIFILLQSRNYNRIKKFIIQFLKPYKVLSPSISIMKTLSGMGINVKFLPLGVNTEIFKPVEREKKIELRKKYALPMNKFIILHVGHINYGRNLRVLKTLQRDNNQVVITSSTSTPADVPKDFALKKELESDGIILFEKYIDNIEEIYQLSDCYVFPVASEAGCIGIPLSVLEAMACNLPVITTKFGGLPQLFKEGEGFSYFNGTTDLLGKILYTKNLHAFKTGDIVKEYAWEKVIGELNEIMHDINA